MDPHDLPPLVDGDLELVVPDAQWVDGWVLACRHPRTVRLEPEAAAVSRERMLDLLAASPRGYQPGDAARGHVPSQTWWMRLTRPDAALPIGGSISLRVGTSDDLRWYVGNVGYWVAPPARGQRLAERSLRLVLGVARRWGMGEVWVTCNPDNFGSRRTLQRLDGELVRIVPLPPSHPLRLERGETEKCRYRFALT